MEPARHDPEELLGRGGEATEELPEERRRDGEDRRRVPDGAGLHRRGPAAEERDLAEGVARSEQADHGLPSGRRDGRQADGSGDHEAEAVDLLPLPHDHLTVPVPSRRPRREDHLPHAGTIDRGTDTTFDTTPRGG
ncbi:hypothetical protein HRbin12_01617 [bacterium HR12]|nr:hypothetical protein HRbin12_01617 [bacterium HR12]